MVINQDAGAQARLHKVNALLGHWMGGINPCTCTRCRDVADAFDAAVAEAISRTKADAIALCAAEFERGLLSGRAETAEAVKERDAEIARLHVEIARLNAKDRDPGRKADLVDKARREERERIVGMLRGFNLPPGYADAIATAIRRPPEGEK